jgi:hypothetical protein
MNMKKLCCLIPLLLSFSVSCEQNPLYDYFNVPPFIYVATSGNDATGDGSQTAPYATIEYAVSKASGRTNICIAVGSYIINNHLVLKKGISLLGAFDAATWTRHPYQTSADRAIHSTNIIVGGGYNYALASSDDPSRTIDIGGDTIDNETIVEGLTIIGNATSIFPCVLYIHNGASPIIRYNTIDGGINDTSPGICGIKVLTNANPLIQNNYITSGSNTFAVSKVFGINVAGARASITGNFITTSTTFSNYSYCIGTTTGSITTISGNTIRLGSNVQVSYAIYSEDAGTQTTIVSNTIDDIGLSGVQNKYAVYCASNNTVIRDNTISFSFTAVQSIVIELNSSQNTIIQHNSITEIGGGVTDDVRGILIQPGSRSIISRNFITINNAATNNVIRDSSTNGNNLICSNYFYTFGTWDAGIYCIFSSPQIVNNTFVINQYGVFLDGAGSNPAIINNAFQSSGITPCIWETVPGTDPTALRNNLFSCSDFYYDDAGGNLPDVAALNALPNASGNIVQIIAVIDPDGNIPLIDRIYVTDLGYNFTPLYPSAMIDITGTARTVPLTIGAYEY